MTTRSASLRMLLAVTTALTVSSGLVLACSSSSTPETQNQGSGTGTGHSSGSGSGETTLYTRLGGHAGIRSAINSIVAEELMNADIASYFFYQTSGTTPPLGHPTAGQIEECFTDLLGNIAGGPEEYPTTLSADAGGPYTCRSLTEAHRDLQINAGTFNAFIAIAGGVLTKAGVASADITTIAGALEGTKGNVVTSTTGPADGATPFPGSVDAALQLDATF